MKNPIQSPILHVHFSSRNPPGDLFVSGFPRRSNGSANGAYAIRGEAWQVKISRSEKMIILAGLKACLVETCRYVFFPACTSS